ncbi:iron ABC transporter permease [Janthinobacterium sp. 17J80-10]|uniref:ABC transporter permease n=1 Tax=Janthinobacterium sp. 17J80-10 TaxID=2497863 RepID=UPI00100595C7|nr:iron ABC transporter permease [Janthinobacterium sp. 17J80-10]QAU35711.1 iron ABC transporter permease [Janthinobacterium sp. 17J80-10]
MNTSPIRLGGAGMQSLAPSPQQSWRGRDWSGLIQFAVMLMTVLLVAAPLVVIGYQSLQSNALYDPERIWTFASFTHLFSMPEFFVAVANSFKLAIVATIVATSIGVAAAIAIVRFDLPFRSWLEGAMLGPIYISQLVLALGWYVLYGPSGYISLLVRDIFGAVPWNLTSITGMGVLGGIAMAPAVMLYCASSLALGNASLEDAARCVGARPWQVLKSVTIPLLRPAIVYSTLLTFVGGIELLSIPLIFGWSAGLEFFTTFLLRVGNSQITPDYGLLGAAALLLLALVASLVLVQQKLLAHKQRYITVRGKSQRPKPLDIGAWRWAVLALMVVYMLMVVILPLIALIVRSFVEYLTPLVSPWEFFTLDNYKMLMEQELYGRSIWNSLKVSTIGAAVATLMIAIVAAVIQRSESRFARPLEMLAMFPRAVPGMIVGVGFLWLVLWIPGFSALHGTLAILIVAFTMRNLPSAYVSVAPSFMQIGKEIDQSARVVGATWWTTCCKIVFPIARPALIACYLLTFISFFKEYASAVFLYSPGTEIIGTTLLNVWAKGDAGPVAALSVIQLILTLILVAIATRFGKKLNHG